MLLRKLLQALSTLVSVFKIIEILVVHFDTATNVDFENITYFVAKANGGRSNQGEVLKNTKKTWTFFKT